MSLKPSKTPTKKTAAPDDSGVIETIPIGLIHPSPSNPRKLFKGIEELAANIKEHGVLQDILVRPKGKQYEIVFGERRFRGAKMAGLKVMRAKVRELDDRSVLELQLIENGKRADIHPLEEGQGYRALRDKHKMSVEEISARLEKSVSHVYARIKLCDLIEPARTAFAIDKLSSSVALLIARIPSDKLQAEALKHCTAVDYRGETLSFKQASDMIQKQYMCKLTDATFDRKDVNLVAGVGACTDCPKRTGAQPELFSDVASKDICTEPSCYARKQDAHWKIATSEAKASGQRVLTKDECKKVFPSEYSHSPSGGYVALNDKASEDPKHRSWKSLVGKDVKPVLARMPSGKVVELLPSAEAKRQARKAGNLQPDPADAKPSKGKNKSTPAQKKRSEEAQQKAARRAEIIAQIVSTAETVTNAPEAFFRWLVGRELEMCARVDKELARRRGCPEGIDELDWIERELPEMPGHKARGLFIEIILAEGYRAELDELADVYGVEVPEEFRSEKASKKAASIEQAKPDVHDPDDEPACRLCGCTENRPCPGGCSWVEDAEQFGDLCSQCKGKVAVDAGQVRYTSLGDKVVVEHQMKVSGDWQVAVHYHDITRPISMQCWSTRRLLDCSLDAPASDRCGATRTFDEDGSRYNCNLPRGHAGKHAAMTTDGHPAATWNELGAYRQLGLDGKPVPPPDGHCTTCMQPQSSGKTPKGKKSNENRKDAS